MQAFLGWVLCFGQWKNLCVGLFQVLFAFVFVLCCFARCLLAIMSLLDVVGLQSMRCVGAADDGVRAVCTESDIISINNI